VLQQNRQLDPSLAEFLDNLWAKGKSPTPTRRQAHARAQAQRSAFIELNRDWPAAQRSIGSEHPLTLAGTRLGAIDSSLVRLPVSERSWPDRWLTEASNSAWTTGTRYPEARLSVIYDLDQSEWAWNVELGTSTMGEVALAIQSWSTLNRGTFEINDRVSPVMFIWPRLGPREPAFYWAVSTEFCRRRKRCFDQRANQGSGYGCRVAGQKAECSAAWMP